MSDEVKMPVPRGKPEAPFLWIGMRAWERIANELGNKAAYGIAIYAALCRLSAKSKGIPEIQVEIAKLAGDSRLSYRTVSKTLNLLRDKAKVLTVTPGKRAPGQVEQPANIYTLIGFGKARGSKSNRPPDRRHIRPPSDGTRSASSFAEIPIDSANSRESIKERGHASDASALPAAGGASALASESTGHQPQATDFEGGW